MKKIVFTAPLAFALAALVATALPRRAAARVEVHIDIGLPAAPPLVVVEPGVQVVEDFDDEVFVTSGWYWVRRDRAWYRARSPRARFVLVEHRHVPATLVRIPPGRYVKYRKAKHHERHHERGDDHGHGHGHDDHRHGHDGHGHDDHGHGHEHDDHGRGRGKHKGKR
jgi:hypothetical protein